VISSRGLTVRPVEDDHRALQIMGYGSGLPTAAPTHWSFGQLCNLASPGNSPASYFRETQMPAPIIVRARLPGIDQRLAEQVVRFVQLVRREGLEKTPGIAETLDWARALVGLDIGSIDEDPAAVQASLICLLKTEADLKRVPKEIAARLIGQVA